MGYKTIYRIKISIVIISCLILNACNYSNTDAPDAHYTSKKVIAYVTDWKNNWGENYERVNQITHINYAFANIKNGKVIEGKENDTEIIKKLVGLKKINNKLKILISIGGWSWSKNFSDAALTEKSREIFASSAIAFMLKHYIDGIDLDWEYPGLSGDNNTFRPEDKENFTALLKLIREKLNSISTAPNRYLLTIATGASQAYLDHTNMRESHKYLDFINIMTYDLHASGGRAGHHAGLHPSKHDIASNPRSVSLGVAQHISAGIPAYKIVLGVPFYGRYKKGVNTSNNGLYEIASGTSGSYNYYEIVDSLKQNTGFVSYWDESAKAPYIWRASDSLFLSYDNEKSIQLKVEYMKSQKMGGIMFWQFDGDSDGSLLQVIHDNLN